MTAILSLENISIYDNGNIRLKNINLRVKRGDKIALLGRSGSGKTTMLKVANGTLKPLNGEVKFYGTRIESLSNKKKSLIGTLWQDLRLIDELSVSQNINSGALARRGFLWSIANLFDLIDSRECMECIKASELEPHLLNVNIKNLSSGQQTRVAIARLINQHSEIILADEPLSNLDPHIGLKVLKTLLEGNTINSIKYPSTCVMSLHQPDLVRHFNRVVGMRMGEITFDCAPQHLKSNQLKKLYR